MEEGVVRKGSGEECGADEKRRCLTKTLISAQWHCRGGCGIHIGCRDLSEILITACDYAEFFPGSGHGVGHSTGIDGVSQKSSTSI